MRKLKLRKRISNFPKAIQLVSDRFEIVYLTPKLFISFKVNCLKWNIKPMVYFFLTDFSPLLLLLLSLYHYFLFSVSNLIAKLGFGPGFDCPAWSNKSAYEFSGVLPFPLNEGWITWPPRPF